MSNKIIATLSQSKAKQKPWHVLDWKVSVLIFFGLMTSAITLKRWNVIQKMYLFQIKHEFY